LLLRGDGVRDEEVLVEGSAALPREDMGAKARGILGDVECEKEKDGPYDFRDVEPPEDATGVLPTAGAMSRSVPNLVF